MNLKKIWFLACLVSVSTLGSTESCRADEWARLQAADQRGQQASAAANSLCASEAPARAKIQDWARQISSALTTYNQRDSDASLNDAQSDYQRLNPLFQTFQNKAQALDQLRGPAQASLQVISGTPGFSGGTISPTPAVLRAAQELLAQARAVHDAIEQEMRENEPLLSFPPKPSYANWMAIANYKQNPAWYQSRDQAHVRLQDDLDALMRLAFAVYGNRTFTTFHDAEVRYIYWDFHAMKNAWDQLSGPTNQAKTATQELISALNNYPGMIRQHRATLAQDAENQARDAEAALQAAQGNCNMRPKTIGDGTVSAAGSLKTLSAPAAPFGVLAGATKATPTLSPTNVPTCPESHYCVTPDGLEAQARCVAGVGERNCQAVAEQCRQVIFYKKTRGQFDHAEQQQYFDKHCKP